MVAERENQYSSADPNTGSQLRGAIRKIVGGGSTDMAAGLNPPGRGYRAASGGAGAGMGHYSSQGVISDVDGFNMMDLQDDRMNEEIQKLLAENRRALNS